MKINKAIRRLEEIESLLAKVIDRYQEVETPERSLLNEAKGNVVRVKTAFQESADKQVKAPPPQPARRLAGKARKPARGSHGKLEAHPAA